MLSTAEALNKSNIYIPKEELEGIIESIAHIVHYFSCGQLLQNIHLCLFISRLKKLAELKISLLQHQTNVCQS